MKRLMSRFLLVGLFSMLLISLWVNAGAVATEQIGTTVGKIAPGFTLLNLNGTNISLEESLQNNKVTVVNFWATWCPPCRGEIPEFVRFYQEYRKKSVEILAINEGENQKTVKDFAQRNKMKFPVLLDVSGRVGGEYQVQFIPITFILDRKGRIREVIPGSTSYGRLKKAVDAVLRGEN